MDGEKGDIAHFCGPMPCFRIVDVAAPRVQSEHGVGMWIAAQADTYTASNAVARRMIQKFPLPGIIHADAAVPDQRRELVPAMMRARIDLDIAVPIVFSDPCKRNRRAKVILAIVAHGVRDGKCKNEAVEPQCFDNRLHRLFQAKAASTGVK